MTRLGHAAVLLCALLLWGCSPSTSPSAPAALTLQKEASGLTLDARGSGPCLSSAGDGWVDLGAPAMVEDSAAQPAPERHLAAEGWSSLPDAEHARRLAGSYFPELEGAGGTLVNPAAALRVTMPATAGGELELATRGYVFHVREACARQPERLLRDEGGAVFAGADHFWTAVGGDVVEPDGRWATHRLEEYIVLPSGDGEYRTRYQLVLPEGIRSARDAGGYLELHDARGPVLRLHGLVVRDRDGRSRQGRMRLSGAVPLRGPEALPAYALSGRSLSVELAVSLDGLRGPLVVDPGWSSTGAPAVGRADHGAVKLPSGKVLMAGGLAGSPVVASAELYDPATGTWSAAAPMASPRRNFRLLMLPNGKALAAGGASDNFVDVMVPTAELYDPAANTWTATGALLTPRVLHITALLPSGKVLVAGGTRGTSLGLTASAELYDPASGTWAATGALATARANSQGVVLPSGKVVAMGGSTGNSSNPALASTELYDPADGTWTTVGSLGAARWGHTATLLPSGEVLVAAGENGNTQLSSAERFNPSTRTWRAAASMSAARSRPTATLLASGKVLVAGSFPNGTSAELYDPASDAWRAVPRLPGSFDHHQATLLDSGKVLLTQFFNPSAVLYDPANLYAPVAQGTGIVVEEDGSRTGTVRATDADMDPVTYSVVTRPAHGEVTFTGPGFTYTPDADFFGNDSFTFKASDGSLESNVATVSIRVTPVDDVPEASDGFLRLSEDSSRALVLAATDVDGDTLSYTIVTPPAHGTLSGTAPNLSYRPAANYHGPDSFTFRVSDGRTQSNVATMELMVDPVNDAPVVRHQALTTAEEVALQVTVTATDADGDPLSYTVQTGTPFFGTVSGTPPNLTYTPAADYFGTERFFVTVSDGKTVSSADIAVTVTPVNDVPVTVSYPQATAEDTGVLVILIGLDADGEPLTYEVVSGPSHGTLSGTAPLLTYRPSADFHGADSFTYRVADAATSSGVSTVSLTVTPENDAPVALALSRGTGQGAAVAVTLQATDVDGDALTYAVVTGPSHGTLTGTPPALTYVPAAGYTGSDSFTFQAHDGTLASNEATVTLTVKVAPVAQDVSVTTRQGTAVSVVLSAQDPNGDALTYTVVEPPAHGTLSGTPPELLYTPADGFSGTDSFRYQAHNGAVGAEGTVSITVTPRGCGGCASTGGGALNALWVLAGMSLLRRRANARAGAPSRGEGEREPHGSRP